MIGRPSIHGTHYIIGPKRLFGKTRLVLASHAKSAQHMVKGLGGHHYIMWTPQPACRPLVCDLLVLPSIGLWIARISGMAAQLPSTASNQQFSSE